MRAVGGLRKQRPFRRLRWLVSRPRTILKRRGRQSSRPRLSTASAAAGRTRPIRTGKDSHLFMPALSFVLLEVNKRFVLFAAGLRPKGCALVSPVLEGCI